MSKTEAPGVIPEWAKQFSDLSGEERGRLALEIGVTERTVRNWAQGRSKPCRAIADAIRRAFRRMGGQGMSAGRHTPGPWGFREPNGKGMGFEIREIGAWFGARVWDPETAANVRLCAASPDLLEALEAVVRVADRDTAEFGLARAAIAKAMGEA